LDGEGEDGIKWITMGSLCFILSGLKVKMGGLKVKFVKVCE